MNNFSQDDLERMRAILAKSDAETVRKGMVEIDLNNPPHKPYRHQEYPKAMHNHGTRKVKPANTPDEQRKLESAGWKEEPFPPVEGYGNPDDDPVLSSADQAEIAALEEKAAKVAADKAAKSK